MMKRQNLCYRCEEQMRQGYDLKKCNEHLVGICAACKRKTIVATFVVEMRAPK